VIPYLSLFLTFCGAVILAFALWGLASLLQPRDSTGGLAVRLFRSSSSQKREPFECGNPFTPFSRRFPVKFYAVALVFVLFDVEAVFFFPWAVQFQELGWLGFVEMGIFVGFLLVGLLYVLRKGALRWT
jgi:NADH-quinone oxidoreductase subunit A